MKNIIKKNQAFTLIEVLVVSVIIAVLVTVASVSFANSQKRSRDARRKADLETVRQALVIYRQDNGSYGNVGAGTAGFNSTVAALFGTGYLTSANIRDPKTGNPDYSLSCVEGNATDCNRVLLTASLEDGTTHEVYTP